MLTDPHLAKLATETESTATRSNFFNQVWDQDTFNPKNYQIAGITAALLATGVFSSVFPGLGPAEFTVMTARTRVGASRVGGSSTTTETLVSRWLGVKGGLHQRIPLGAPGGLYTELPPLAWRICEEMVGFKFDSLVPSIQKPLQLMVGEIDNYPQVHFLENVMTFAKVLTGPGRARVITDTGHSIHNERPTFLASQIIAMPILPHS